ncbi:DUF4384 domain-containing protein, partial [bacterium]|nr:DUF4384 domain-containing protein [bacterium]
PRALYVHGFQYEENGVKASSEFGDWISSEMENLLEQSSKVFHVIRRERIRELVRSRDWQVEPVTPAIPENIGMMAGAEFVLTGEYREWGDRIKVSAFIADAGKRRIVADASALLERTGPPQDVALYSENHENVVFEDLRESAVDGVNAIGLEVFVNHADNSEYSPGDTLIVYVRSDRDCFIRILYRDSEGNDLTLFPAYPSDDPFIRAGRLYRFPPEATYHVVAVEPFGTECLKVFASTDPRMVQSVEESVNIRVRGMQILKDQKGAAYSEKTLTIRVAP